MNEVIYKARILAEALPYLHRFRSSTFVIKAGGAVIEEEGPRARLAADIALLSAVGIRVVLVHGGGKQITEMSTRLGVGATFKDGVRVTDEAALEVAMMVLGGSLNRALVGAIGKHGARAVGLTGKDGNLVRARISRPELGLVGEVSHVDPSVLEALGSEFVPVVAPLATSESDGGTLNVNADTFAAALAAALRADKLVLLTDVDGVRDDEGRVIPTLECARAEELIGAGVIRGGMIPKVECAMRAARGGVGKAHIIDGRVEHALLLEIFTSDGIGTEVVAESEPR